MKRILALFCVILLIGSAAGCGKKDTPPDARGTWVDQGVRFSWSDTATDAEKDEIRNDLYSYLGGTMEDAALFAKLGEINSVGLDEVAHSYTFNDDQSGQYHNGSLTYSFHWELADHTVTVEMEDGYTATFTIDKDQMLQAVEEGGLRATTVFVRQ